jgi:Flp pilus assembly protein TadG
MRQRKQGQAIVELAIVTPVIILLLFGGFNVGAMISDKIMASSACRAGARLAVGIGGAQRADAQTGTAQVDAAIVHNVLVAAGAMNFASVTRIVIYEPTRLDGVYTVGDSADIYDGNGVAIGPATYPLTARIQAPPDQTLVGCEVDWTYTPPMGASLMNMNLNEYAVMQMTPVEN